jgi:Tetracyclin repressor-like, C-terminal domain
VRSGTERGGPTGVELLRAADPVPDGGGLAGHVQGELEDQVRGEQAGRQHGPLDVGSVVAGGQPVGSADLRLVDSDASRNAILALVRSAVSNDKAAAMLREFLTAELLPSIARLTSQPDARPRAALVATPAIEQYLALPESVATAADSGKGQSADNQDRAVGEVDHFVGGAAQHQAGQVAAPS